MPEPLRADRRDAVVLAPELLTTNGFGALRIDNGDGSIKVPADVALTAAPGGSVTFTAANLDIEGQISAPGGSLSFTTFDYSPYAFVVLDSQPDTAKIPPPDPTRGHFTLGSGASLSTAGLIVDDRIIIPEAGTLPLLTAGGAITINSYSADLATGSVIDVSGGVAFSATAKRTYGNGGSILIKTGQDANLSALIGGKLTLDATLEGFSGTQGGSLTLQATAVRVGGAPGRIRRRPATRAGVFQRRRIRQLHDRWPRRAENAARPVRARSRHRARHGAGAGRAKPACGARPGHG